MNKYHRSRTALTSALLNGCDEYVRMLIDAGADVNESDINSRTPVICAAEKGLHTWIPVLVKAGADVNTRPALQHAATFGHEECVKALLQGGADVNQADDVGSTPLINAIEGLHCNCMKILIEAGASVNYRDFDNSPVLINLGFAVGYHGPSKSTKAVRCTQLMLKSGVKINRRDMFRKNSLETALTELYKSKSKSQKDCLKVAPMMFFAAGEKLLRKLKKNPGVPSELVKRQELLGFLPLIGRDFSLKHLCRKLIRKRLLQLDKHINLLTRVTQLGLPEALSDYLVYDMSLEKEYTFDDDNGDDDNDDGDDDDNNNDDDDSEEEIDEEEEDDDNEDDDDDNDDEEEASDGSGDTFDSFSDFNIEDDSDDDSDRFGSDKDEDYNYQSYG